MIMIFLLLTRIEELEEELKSEKAKSDVLLEQQRLVMMIMLDGVILLCVVYLQGYESKLQELEKALQEKKSEVPNVHICTVACT